MKSVLNQSVSIPFYGDTLYLVNHQGEAYTPMKPIVEAMGLAWQPQHKKFQDDPGRWGITLKVIQLPCDTQTREVLLLPVRKLFGWMMTISPSRVKPEIRDKVIQYQNECDDILWMHWSEKYKLKLIGGLEPSEADHIVSLKNLEIVCGYRRSSAAILYFFLQNESSDLAEKLWFKMSYRKLAEYVGFSHTGLGIALKYLCDSELLFWDLNKEVNNKYYYRINHKILNQKLRQHHLPGTKEFIN